MQGEKRYLKHKKTSGTNTTREVVQTQGGYWYIRKEGSGTIAER